MASGGATGVVQLPQRAADMIGGQLVSVVNGVITLGFTPSALVPMPALTQYYVRTTGSDANNGLSVGSPKLTMDSAITAGNAAAVPFAIDMGPGLFPRTSATVVPTQPCKITGAGPTTTIEYTGSNHNWSLDTGTTWRATFTTTSVCRVLDWLNYNSDGFPTALAAVGSLATCRATPGSWFDTGSILYVNRLDGATVTDANTVALLNSVAGRTSSTSGNFWIQNMMLLGGSEGNIRAQGNATGKVYVSDMMLGYARGTVRDADALRVLDVLLTVGERITTYSPDKDGLNNHSANASIPAMVLVSCKSTESGFYPLNTSCNGPTTHDAGVLLDIFGSYSRNHGSSCAHINTNTIGVHVGTTAIDDYGDIDRGGTQPPNTGYAALTGATLYRYGCVGNAIALGGTLVDMTLA